MIVDVPSNPFCELPQQNTEQNPNPQVGEELCVAQVFSPVSMRTARD